MKADPVDVAFMEIADTIRRLEFLTTSSETCDYPRAKAMLGELRSKIRELGKLEARLSQSRASAAEEVIRFPSVG